MPEAGFLSSAASSPAWSPDGAAADPYTDSRLLRTLHTLIQPTATALSLWGLAWFFEGGLSPAWLMVSVLAFALAFPGRGRLPSCWRELAASLLANWAGVLALLLLAGLATGQLQALSGRVLLHWLWLAPATQIVAHGALRRLAP